MFNLLLDPNVAYVMLVIGFTLSVLALFAPGTGILEIGAIFTLFLAGYSILNLPINTWALVILILGVVPFFLALRRSRHWIFLIFSIIALIVGTIFIFKTEEGITAIQPVLAIFVSLTATSMFWFIGRASLQAIEQAPSFDLKTLVDDIGEARTDIDPEGSVYIQGEEWSARSEKPIKAGSKIQVLQREGLMLIIEEYSVNNENS